MLHYYCGFTKVANPKIQTFISSFQTKLSSFKDILPLLHCFFEAQKPSLCQLVDPRFIPNEQQRLSAKDLTPVDFLVVGYFLSSLLSTSTANTPTIHLVVDGIDDHRLKMLLNNLSKNPVGGITGALSLRLELCNPSITEQGVSHIVSLLKVTSAISELVLSDGNIHSDEDVLLHIAEALQENTSLTNLSLPCMSLHHTKQNGSALTKMLQVNKSLTHLDLSRNVQISDSGARCIFEGLQHNITVFNLNLSQTGITAIDPDTARSLTKMVQVNKSIRLLDLSCNRAFTDSETHCIFEGLQHNDILVNLNLSKSGITSADPGARSLTKMLHVNKSLTHLDLSNNCFWDSGACCIFEELQNESALVKLNLSFTGLTVANPDTARALTKMLCVNKSLTHLNLKGNAIFDSGVCCIFEGLVKNTTLVYMNLSDTCVMVEDIDTAKALTDMLKTNKCLTHLDLSCNFLGHYDNGINRILKSLEFEFDDFTFKNLFVDSEILPTFKKKRTAKLPPIHIFT